MGPEKRVYHSKDQRVMAVQIDTTCMVTAVSGSIVAGPGNWIIYEGGRLVTVLSDAKFRERYETGHFPGNEV